MLKKVLWTVSIFAAAAALISCGKTGKYQDVKPVVIELTSVFETFNSDAAAVKEAKDLVKAFDRLGDELEKIAPQMKALQKKYPEIKSEDEPAPAELKDDLDKLEAAVKSIQVTMASGRLIKYMTDPEVIKSAQRFQKALMSLGE